MNKVARMTLMEHLTELRRRLIISFIAIGVGAIGGWLLYNQIINFLLDPYCQILEARQECTLYVRDPFEPFTLKLTVAGYSGLGAAIPVILWQVWRFVAPGLYSREKKYAIPFIAGGVGLFALGVSLAYWSIPRALEFLIGLGADNFEELLSPLSYISFVVKMMVAFGVAFQFPIVLIFLQILGVVENKTLRSGRRYALVGIVVLVAIITPSGDPFTLMVLSVPMYLFYEVAILFGRIRLRRAAKNAAAA